MTLEKLTANIVEYNVPDRWYSIDSVLKGDALIVRGSEFFYLDEKGQTNNYWVFSTNEDAYDYLWEALQKDMKLFKLPHS